MHTSEEANLIAGNFFFSLGSKYALLQPRAPVGEPRNCARLRNTHILASTLLCSVNIVDNAQSLPEEKCLLSPIASQTWRPFKLTPDSVWQQLGAMQTGMPKRDFYDACAYCSTPLWIALLVYYSEVTCTYVRASGSLDLGSGIQWLSA